MKPNDVVSYFKTQAKAAEALGISQSAVSQWFEDGEVPFLRQMHIQVVTNGALVACSEGSCKEVN